MGIAFLKYINGHHAVMDITGLDYNPNNGIMTIDSGEKTLGYIGMSSACAQEIFLVYYNNSRIDLRAFFTYQQLEDIQKK